MCISDSNMCAYKWKRLTDLVYLIFNEEKKDKSKITLWILYKPQ